MELDPTNPLDISTPAQELGVRLDALTAAALTSMADGNAVYVFSADQYNELCNIAAELQG